jgi:glycosyltransferase involved in cell wall biosynthesis
MATSVGIPPQKLWGTWASGVDQELFSAAEEFRQWPSAGEPIHLIYVGLLQHERNLFSLVEAVERANAQGLSFRLSLAGKGPERSALVQSTLHMDGRVRILDPVPHNKVPRLLSQAHVGVLAFPDEEKFRVSSPIKLFEYVASGMPILATRIACHTDVVEDGKYVFWAEDATTESLLAALNQVWREQSSLSEMGCAASAVADRWTWQESGASLKRALELGLSKAGVGVSSQTAAINT